MVKKGTAKAISAVIAIVIISALQAFAFGLSSKRSGYFYDIFTEEFPNLIGINLFFSAFYFLLFEIKSRIGVFSKAILHCLICTGIFVGLASITYMGLSWSRKAILIFGSIAFGSFVYPFLKEALLERQMLKLLIGKTSPTPNKYR